MSRVRSGLDLPYAESCMGAETNGVAFASRPLPAHCASMGDSLSLSPEIHRAITWVGDGVSKSIDWDSLQQADRLQTLNEVGRAIASTLDLQTLHETSYQQIGRVCVAEEHGFRFY